MITQKHIEAAKADINNYSCNVMYHMLCHERLNEEVMTSFEYSKACHVLDKRLNAFLKPVATRWARQQYKNYRLQASECDPYCGPFIHYIVNRMSVNKSIYDDLVRELRMDWLNFLSEYLRSIGEK